MPNWQGHKLHRFYRQRKTGNFNRMEKIDIHSFSVKKNPQIKPNSTIGDTKCWKLSAVQQEWKPQEKKKHYYRINLQGL